MPESTDAAKLSELSRRHQYRHADHVGRQRPLRQPADGPAAGRARRNAVVLQRARLERDRADPGQSTRRRHPELSRTPGSRSTDRPRSWWTPPRAEELWNPFVEAWLPQGPTDPSVVLIKVDRHRQSTGTPRAGKVASLISFVKAKLTGERYDGGDQGRVEL